MRRQYPSCKLILPLLLLACISPLRTKAQCPCSAQWNVITAPQCFGEYGLVQLELLPDCEAALAGTGVSGPLCEGAYLGGEPGTQEVWVQDCVDYMEPTGTTTQYTFSWPDLTCAVSFSVTAIQADSAPGCATGSITGIVSTTGCSNGITRLFFNAFAEVIVNGIPASITPGSFIGVNDQDEVTIMGLSEGTYTLEVLLDPYCIRSGCSATQQVVVPSVGCTLQPAVEVLAATTAGSCTDGLIRASAVTNACDGFTAELYGPGPVLIASASGLSGEVVDFPAAQGNYQLRIATLPAGCEQWLAVPVGCVGGPFGNAAVSMRAYLQGPYDADQGLMTDDLRIAGYIPQQEPYTAMGYIHGIGGGGESIDDGVLEVSGNDAVVDWVVVELRDVVLPQNRLYTRSALLQRDGDVVDMDGVSPLIFNAGPGDFYVAVRHRNHLGCMTAGPLPLSSVLTAVDFTLPATPTYGSGARIIDGTVGLLWAGDVNFDHTVQYTAAENDRDAVLVAIGGTTPTNTTVGYLPSDVDLDGVVRYTGTDNDRDPILFTIGGVTPTAVRTEQIP